MGFLQFPLSHMLGIYFLKWAMRNLFFVIMEILITILTSHERIKFLLSEHKFFQGYDISTWQRHLYFRPGKRHVAASLCPFKETYSTSTRRYKIRT